MFLPLILWSLGQGVSYNSLLASQSLHLLGHVDHIPTMQFFIGISRNTQSKSYAIVDWVCLGFTESCIMGYSLTWPIISLSSSFLSSDYPNNLHCFCLYSLNFPNSSFLHILKLKSLVLPNECTLTQTLLLYPYFIISFFTCRLCM